MSTMRPKDPTLHARAWAEAHVLIDRRISPLGLPAIEALAAMPGEVVLDIGCGAGETLLQLARRVGPAGTVIGVDIAPLLLEIARRRTTMCPTVRLIEADAEALDLPTASADAVFSRFGVMGFANPAAAFARFRRILKPSGRLAFVCWQALADNPLDLFPLSAAGFAAPVDDSPFSFADPAHVRALLTTAGFGEIDIASHRQAVSSGDLDAMTEVLLKVGPLGRILRETPALRGEAEPRLRTALAGLGDPAHVALPAAVWIVTARAA